MEECIRLVFAWNNALISNPDAEIEEPTSPTGVRLKTPPTVEMIDPQGEEEEAAAAEETKEEKSETETKTETPEENVETEPEQKVEEVKEESDEASKAASVAINTYENPLLADVSF